MKFSEMFDWRRIADKLHDYFYGPPQCADDSISLHPGCIARQYAQCDDFTNCPSCGTVEQSLRASSWIKLNWRRMQRRD